MEESNRALKAEMTNLNANITTMVKVATEQFLKDTIKAVDDKVTFITKNLDQIFKNHEARVNNQGFWPIVIAGLVLLDTLAHTVPLIKAILK